MERRQFLRTLATAGLFGWLPKPFGGGVVASESWKDLFASARAKDPWLSGYTNVASEVLKTPNLTIEGVLPEGLRGTFYRNGSAGHELGGERYYHWFDGDGMVQAIRFTDAGVSHLGRFVRTSKRSQEAAAGRYLYPAFGTIPANPRPIQGPDTINVANISVLVHAGVLFALWEGGSAHQLDPQTLETQGRKIWRDDLVSMPFSAHPKVEPNGTLWNFGLSLRRGALAIYRINQMGDLQEVAVVQVGSVGMLHDFAVTERHLIFLLQPLIFERDRLVAGRSFLDSHVWRPERALRVLTVEKDDLSRTKWYELPAGFLFHFGNAWEEPGGVIHFDYCRYDDPSVMTVTFREVMRGQHVSAPHARTVLVTLDPARGRAQEEALAAKVEFPRVDPRVVARRNRHLYSVMAPGRRKGAFGFDAVARRDLKTGQLDLFHYGEEFLVEEHILVPRPGSSREGDGWLIGTALDLGQQATRVSVFDGLHLAAGPVASCRLPYVLPLGFHGTFASFTI